MKIHFRVYFPVNIFETWGLGYYYYYYRVFLLTEFCIFDHFSYQWDQNTFSRIRKAQNALLLLITVILKQKKTQIGLKINVISKHKNWQLLYFHWCISLLFDFEPYTRTILYYSFETSFYNTCFEHVDCYFLT